MSRRKTVFVKGGLYHLVNRAAFRTKVFKQAVHSNTFLQILKECARRYQVSIVAYCIMPNHFHLVVQQSGQKSISDFMRALQRKFAWLYNLGNKRSGAVFEGRFRSNEVNDDPYLFTLLAYVHLNPVKAKLCKQPSEWPHSNYNDFVGAKPDTLTNHEVVNSLMSDMQLYVSFVEDRKRRLK